MKISLSTNARDWETPLVIQIYSFDHLKTFLNEKYGGTVSELYYFNKSYNKLLPLRNLEELALNDIVIKNFFFQKLNSLYCRYTFMLFLGFLLV